MRGSGRGIDARTSRCRSPSPDRLLGPPSREAIRGAPYKGQELRGRRSRQSKSFQTRPVRVYSSIQFSESIVAGFGGASRKLQVDAVDAVCSGPYALSQRESHPSPVLAFDSIGHGKDSVVVLLHGWPLNRSIWSGVAPRIAAAGSRVLAPDLPGFGDSPSIELGRATVEAYADEVAKFIGPFRARRVAVAGHSFGGYVALALAERLPDQVAGLGLIASRTTADSETARQGRRDTIEKVRTGGTKVLLPGLAEKLIGPRGGATWRHQAELLIERARPDGVIAALAAMATRPDRTVVFDSFAGPRLVIHGTEDGLIPVSEAARIERGPPDVRAILAGAGHTPMWDASEATAEAIIAWTKPFRA
ncbi:MAG TPA: alpha/beta hydrolase [Thermoplasmata archaeon]